MGCGLSAVVAVLAAGLVIADKQGHTPYGYGVDIPVLVRSTVSYGRGWQACYQPLAHKHSHYASCTRSTSTKIESRPRYMLLCSQFKYILVISFVLALIHMRPHTSMVEKCAVCIAPKYERTPRSPAHLISCVRTQFALTAPSPSFAPLIVAPISWRRIQCHRSV